MLGDGTALDALTAGPFDDSAAWSPDGRRIVFVQSGAGLSILDVETGATSSVATPLASIGSPAWHPTMDLLTVEGSTGTLSSIYTITLAGQIEQLTRGTSNDVGPIFAPEGDAIIFVSDRSGSYEIHRLEIGTGAVTSLTTRSQIVGRATLRSDGCELVYTRAPSAAEADLVSLDICTAGARPKSLAQAGSEPSFAPGDGALVFATQRFGGSSIMYWPARGEAPVPVMTGSGLASAPALAP